MKQNKQEYNQPLISEPAKNSLRSTEDLASTASVEQIIDTLLDALSLEEKAKLLNGNSSFRSFPVPRLNIPAIQYLDGGTGINLEQLLPDRLGTDTGTTRLLLSNYDTPENLSPTNQELLSKFKELLKDEGYPDYQPGCYPPGILLASTWSPEVIYNCGVALGQEALAYHVDILLGTPNVNLHRDPRNGRLFEGYSEDPYLVSALAPSLVQGVQQSGVLANVKHFAANNLEAYRQGIDEAIPMRVLQELYFPGFRACIEDGKVKTLMTAYNRINGVACTENKEFLENILRDEWGFAEGLIISDWGAVYNQTAALNGGNDMDMPGPRSQAAVLEALHNGQLTKQVLNQHVRRLLLAVAASPTGRKTGVFASLHQSHSDDNQQSTPPCSLTVQDNAAPSPDASSNTVQLGNQAAYDAALEGCILLKNNHCLPLPSTAALALVGNNTLHFHDCGDGSARVYTNRTTSLRDHLLAHDFTKVDAIDSPEALANYPYTHLLYAPYVQGQEGRDRTDLSLSSLDRDNIQKLIAYKNRYGCKLILLLNVCGPVDLSWCIEELDGVFCIFFPGMEGGHAVADLLSGKKNPSGKLPITFPKSLKDCPTYLQAPAPDWTICYGEGLYVGYRYYDKTGIAPMFPFGFGLSYSEFIVTPLPPAHPKTYTANEHISVEFTLENVSDYDGKEVVQLYVSHVKPTLDKPLRELKGFKKILQPKHSKGTYSIDLPVSSLASYDPRYKEFLVESGEYQLYLGTSCQDLKAPITVVVAGDPRYAFGKDTAFIQILDHSKAYATLLEHCKDYEIDETHFQGFAIYTPYFSLDHVLNQVLGWKLEGDQLLHAKARLYDALYPIPHWK